MAVTEEGGRGALEPVVVNSEDDRSAMNAPDPIGADVWKEIVHVHDLGLECLDGCEWVGPDTERYPRGCPRTVEPLPVTHLVGVPRKQFNLVASST
jgi:hypothetical protein